MRMILKNTEKEKRKINFTHFKKYLTYKNLMIFLGSFIIINIILGIIFYLYMNQSDKEIINSNITNYFKIAESYSYLENLKNSILNNIGNMSIIWILGISVIGIFIVIFIFFAETFSIGFSIASIIGAYGGKGLIGIISYLFPGKILYLIMLYIITYFAIRFSIQIIKYLFFKKDIDLRGFLKKYVKILIIVIIISLVCSILEIFVNPLMIKLFTFFLK